jgi:phage minor structural protein
MIPILYEKDETAFTSNGLGRLRDCISCVVTEERNGIYECDFEYPVDGINYDRIQCGRIIAVEHDESNDVQPFDIVGYSRPINGVVTFHAVHISYRQTALTVSGTNINSLADAFTLLGNAQPSNPFNYWTDKDSVGFMASGDGVPHSVRSILGGMEGSILDSYGGEYEWDTWTVKLWASRGSLKNFTIRYGVNLTDYSEDLDYTDTYTSVIPYWKGQDSDGNDLIIQGDMQSTSYPSFNGSGRCIPLDVTDKFNSEDGTPTKAQVEAQGMAHINENQPYLPSQNIKVDFVRISDSSEYSQFKPLQTCKLCDSVNVMFDRYNIEGTFKIVKTEYDVLQERYLTMELGTLSMTLSEALGITPDSTADLRTSSVDDYVVDVGTNTYGTYRKWNSGIAECWGTATIASNSAVSATLPITFTSTSGMVINANCVYMSTGTYVAPTISVQKFTTYINLYARVSTSTVQNGYQIDWSVRGTWK